MDRHNSQSSEGLVYARFTRTGLLAVDRSHGWGQALGCSTVQTHSQVFMPRSDVQPCSRCATEQGCSLEPGAQGLVFQVQSGISVNENKGTNENANALSSVTSSSHVKKSWWFWAFPRAFVSLYPLGTKHAAPAWQHTACWEIPRHWQSA